MTDEHRPQARTLIERVVLAMRLDLEFYTLVSADRSATFQAFMVVVLGGLFNGLGLVRRLGGFGVWAGIVAALAGWLLWTLVLLLMARLLGHRRSRRSLLRTLGFANAPEVLLILAGMPLVASTVRVLVVCWLLATATVALQAVYTIGRRRAAAIVLVGFAVYLLIGVGSAYLLGGRSG
jgi:hypothetical protein